MKISVLLPYKENFSPEYPGAVSLFVYETTKISKFKKNITVYGNTDFKKIFKGLNDLKYQGDFILQTARAIDGNHSEVIKNYQTFVSEEFFGKFK